jgi:hypothetical protein
MSYKNNATVKFYLFRTQENSSWIIQITVHITLQADYHSKLKEMRKLLCPSHQILHDT